MSRRLYVRNFGRYQHYKGETRHSPPWVKLHRSFFIDPDVRSWSPTTRYIALGLVVVASESESKGDAKEIKGDAKYLQDRLGVTAKQMREALICLQKSGFLTTRAPRPLLAKREQNPPLDREIEKEKPEAFTEASYDGTASDEIADLIRESLTL